MKQKKKTYEELEKELEKAYALFEASKTISEFRGKYIKELCDESNSLREEIETLKTNAESVKQSFYKQESLTNSLLLHIRHSITNNCLNKY